MSESAIESRQAWNDAVSKKEFECRDILDAHGTKMELQRNQLRVALEMIAELHEDNEDADSYTRATLLHEARDIARLYLQNSAFTDLPPICDSKPVDTRLERTRAMSENEQPGDSA